MRLGPVASGFKSICFALVSARDVSVLGSMERKAMGFIPYGDIYWVPATRWLSLPAAELGLTIRPVLSGFSFASRTVRTAEAVLVGPYRRDSLVTPVKNLPCNINNTR